MDAVNLAYYAVICALLSVAAPYLNRRIIRLGVGALVGLVAAGALPLLKAVFGPLPY